jgi:hypothetical protein
MTGGTGGPGGGALREFRDDYLRIRRRMHVARMKSDILTSAGLS